MADNVCVIIRETQYLVELPVPPEYKGTERKVAITQMRCVFPGFSDSYVEFEVSSVYNATKNALGLGDSTIRKVDKLSVSHEKCHAVMTEMGILPYDGRYSREYIYIRYVRAEEKKDWVNTVQFLRTAIKSQNALIQAKRLFYDTTEYPSVPVETLAYATDVPTTAERAAAREQFARTYHAKEDKQLLELAGFKLATNGIMYKIFENKDIRNERRLLN